MSTHRLELTLARELCTHPIPCQPAMAAARLILANPTGVLRVLTRIITKHPTAA
jgi:hypothetical protein